MTYNGHKNHAHWNQALWIGNDERLYLLALQCLRVGQNRDAAVLMFLRNAGDKTPDGVPWSKSGVKSAMRGLTGWAARR